MISSTRGKNRILPHVGRDRCPVLLTARNDCLLYLAIAWPDENRADAPARVSPKLTDKTQGGAKPGQRSS
jgi:hypothetical protein